MPNVYMSKLAHSAARIGTFTVKPWHYGRLRSAYSLQLRWNSTRANQKPNDGALVQEALRKYMRWYPQDAVTYATIQTYMDLRRNSGHTQNLLVGVVYENDHIKKSTKFVEALLADPLASGNDRWFSALESRPRDINNMIVYLDHEKAELLLPEAFQRTTNQMTAESPILSGDRRPRYPEVFEGLDDHTNNIILLEINRHDDVPKLVDVCHYYIYVTSEFSTLMDWMPRHVQKKILLTVVDNSEYSPLSSETSPVTFDMKYNVTHHAVKISSKKVVQGAKDYLTQGTQAGSHYFDTLQQSNIIEVYKFLLWFSRTQVLSQWQFHIIRDEISQNTLLEEYIHNVYEDLRLNSIASCSSEMHSELQKDLIPNTDEFFSRKLRWWMLYWKNDNVEYALKDYFMKGFMPKSIAAYNYLKGQLVARMQEQKYAKYNDSFEVTNPLEAFKLKLINERILLEVQLVIYTTIVSAFVYYQLPLTILSLVGYGWFGIQANTAVAVTTLGWVLGFNQVSKQWHEFTEKWLHQLYEEVRLVISKGCVENGLLKELNARFEAAKELAEIKKLVVEALDKVDDDQ